MRVARTYSSEAPGTLLYVSTQLAAVSKHRHGLEWVEQRHVRGKLLQPRVAGRRGRVFIVEHQVVDPLVHDQVTRRRSSVSFGVVQQEAHAVHNLSGQLL